MAKKILTAIILSFVMTLCPVYSAANYNYTSSDMMNNSPNLQGYALFVPAGVTCSAVLSNEINSLSAIVGQTINLVLPMDFKYNGKLIAPSGSTIMGSVVQTKKAGYGNRNAKMLIKFTTIRTPYNNIIPINAVIATKDGSGMLRGATTLDSAKEYAKDGAIGAVTGTVAGVVAGAIRGDVGQGALYGAAVGGTMGLIKRTTDKGEEIRIPANSEINILFKQPITLTAQ